MDYRIPSKITDRYWLIADNFEYRFSSKKANRRSGKWLIFDTPETIDQYWEKIKVALADGKLGPSAKVSTARDSAHVVDKQQRVICVYTEDFDFKADLQRIVDNVRTIGINNRLVYKLDADAGRSKNQGDSLGVSCFVPENKTVIVTVPSRSRTKPRPKT